MDRCGQETRYCNLVAACSRRTPLHAYVRLLVPAHVVRCLCGRVALVPRAAIPSPVQRNHRAQEKQAVSPNHGPSKRSCNLTKTINRSKLPVTGVFLARTIFVFFWCCINASASSWFAAETQECSVCRILVIHCSGVLPGELQERFKAFSS